MTVEDTTVDVGVADHQTWVQRVVAWSPEERAEKEKKLMRKIDLRLMPILVRCYLMPLVSIDVVFLASLANSQSTSFIIISLTAFQIIMYIMNYIDRNALPQARLQGLEKDLGMKGVDYNIVLSLTFIGYILMQIPSSLLLGYFRPSLYLSTVMVG